ncbi:MAG: asparagine synthase (glutamine-hydrolyzing) [Sandaracinaceae bacterium]|nr:asparagine synthase (glutamine-hydrolyzing) [Sandaracinaceae bacterium]
MCGIAGFVGARGADARARLTRMADLSTHRGPDERGLWLGEQVGLACRRLAIVDVAHGQQPMRDAETGTTLVMNGELYGHAALREALEARGHRFRTRSDTEVLLAGWLAWGEAVFERVDGMLACAIWSPARRELVLARDRFGKKPLHYARHEGALWFASEMKALLTLPGFPRRLDPRASEHFLLFEHVFDPMTPFEGIAALPPAHVARVRADRLDAMETRRYWRVPVGVEDGTPATIEAAAEELGALLDDAVARRTMGDVPVGALLSGGIDSSLVCAWLRARDAFSIGFADPYLDESAHQDAVAAHVGATLHRFDFDERLEEVFASYPEAQWLGEHADPSFEQDILLRHVTTLAAERGYVVLLGGEGADELFRGYRHHRLHPHLVRYAARSDLEEIPESLGLDDDDFAELAEAEARARATWGTSAHLLAPSFPLGVLVEPRLFEPLAREVFVSPPAAARMVNVPALPAGVAPESLDALAYVEAHTRLPAYILRTLDRYSMASGVEVRCPFLDHRLFEWHARLPRALRDAAPGDKPLLRALARERLPPSIAAREKQPFAAPCVLSEALLADDGRERLAALLAPRAIEALEVVRPAWVRAALERRARGSPDADHPVERAEARLLERVLALRLLASVFIDEIATYEAAHLARHGVARDDARRA